MPQRLTKIKHFIVSCYSAIVFAFSFYEFMVNLFLNEYKIFLITQCFLYYLFFYDRISLATLFHNLFKTAWFNIYTSTQNVSPWTMGNKILSDNETMLNNNSLWIIQLITWRGHNQNEKHFPPRAWDFIFLFRSMPFLTASNGKQSLLNASTAFLKQIECKQNLKVPVHVLNEPINLELTQTLVLLSSYFVDLVM